MSNALPLAAPSLPHLVVVAEDDDEMRRLLTRALRRDGHDVLAVPDGASLFSVIDGLRRQGREADLIVSDVRMPHGSGLEVVARLRAEACTTRVILVSAFADAATHARAAAIGVAYVMSKPFDLDDLRTVATHLLDR